LSKKRKRRSGKGRGGRKKERNSVGRKEGDYGQKKFSEREFEVRALFQRGELLGKKNFLKMRSRGRFWERRRLDERRMRERKN
jgi:hypothetical protein